MIGATTKIPEQASEICFTEVAYGFEKGPENLQNMKVLRQD